MKYQIAPMWFSKNLEKDKVFRNFTGYSLSESVVESFNIAGLACFFLKQSLMGETPFGGVVSLFLLHDVGSWGILIHRLPKSQCMQRRKKR
jgi:hypothetical protein